MKSKALTLALAAAFAAGPLAAPTFVSAQPRDAYQDQTYNDYCRHKKKEGQRTGAILGGIFGALFGNAVSSHGGKPGGTVIGAAAGAAVGSNIGLQSAKCDDRGAYWSQEETYAYDDPQYYRRGGHYDDNWYRHRKCRWAKEYNNEWIRVCPDRQGRYHYSD